MIFDPGPTDGGAGNKIEFIGVRVMEASRGSLAKNSYRLRIRLFGAVGWEIEYLLLLSVIALFCLGQRPGGLEREAEE